MVNGLAKPLRAESESLQRRGRPPPITPLVTSSATRAPGPTELERRHVTTDETMPEKRCPMGQWTPERCIRWAQTIGPNTADLTRTVLGSGCHIPFSRRFAPTGVQFDRNR